MQLNKRVYTAAFEQNLKKAGGNAGQALNDLTSMRQFLTGNALFAFFDAPWFPVYLIVIFFFNPALGFFALGGTADAGRCWPTSTRRSPRKPLAEANTHGDRSRPRWPPTTCAMPKSSNRWACCRT